MHIPPFDNDNKPIIDVENNIVPNIYFNIVKLSKDEEFSICLRDHEICIVPATGTIEVNIGGKTFENVGNRITDVWDGEPECVYIPCNQNSLIKCISKNCELFIAGAKYDKILEPFVVRSDDIDLIQYGSDDTKTHRKIKHLLGQKQSNKVGRLLVSELFTVGAGGWSGFPSHKHDTDRLPLETKHDETYNFRFKPNHGSALQLLQSE